MIREMGRYQLLKLSPRNRAVPGAFATAQDAGSDAVMVLELAADGHVIRPSPIGELTGPTQAGLRGQR